MLYDFFNYFPNKISIKIKENLTEEKIKQLEEIRLRNNQNIILKFNNEEKILEYKVLPNDVLETLQNICENSIYSYQKEICNGYITIKGGHRVGVTGSCVLENGRTININYISSLNFRIAKQILDCSNETMKYILDEKNQTVFSTLIVSLPGAGKTTLIRDIIRKLSSRGLTIGLVDERCEISAIYKGVPQNDLGPRTDVLTNISKPLGIKMLIRSMAPEVIVADEIGSNEDMKAIKEVMCSRNKKHFYSTWRKPKDFIF